MSSDRAGVEKKVAFIGLGKMGLPMASNLLAKGFTVTGFDLSAQARDEFVTRGGRSADSARAAAAGHKVIITMLPTSAIVMDCLIGSGDAVADVPAGALVIDMSSSVPGDTLKLGAELEKRGISLVDAPVSGGVTRAISGQLAIMAGSEHVDRALPYLEAMGSRIFRTGKLGSGHVMKVLNNYVSAAGALATMEALILGRDFGLDEELITDILNASTGRNNTTERKVKEFILSKSWASGFEMALMSKDVSIAAALSREMGLNLEMLAETEKAWQQATALLQQGADHTEIYRYVDQVSHARK